MFHLWPMQIISTKYYNRESNFAFKITNQVCKNSSHLHVRIIYLTHYYTHFHLKSLWNPLCNVECCFCFIFCLHKTNEHFWAWQRFQRFTWGVHIIWKLLNDLWVEAQWIRQTIKLPWTNVGCKTMTNPLYIRLWNIKLF